MVVVGGVCVSVLRWSENRGVVVGGGEEEEEEEENKKTMLIKRGKLETECL